MAVSRRNQGRNKETRPGSLLDDMTWRMALIIGVAQCIAMWPGVSRSLVTIVGGLLVGLSMEAAVEYSFLLGVVTLGAATAYDTMKHGQLMLQTFDHYSLTIGVVVAFIAASDLREVDGQLPVPAWIGDLWLLPGNYRGTNGCIFINYETYMDLSQS